MEWGLVSQWEKGDWYQLLKRKETGSIMGLGFVGGRREDYNVTADRPATFDPETD